MGVAGVVAFVVFRRGALFVVVVVVVVAAAVVVVVRARFFGEGETSVGLLLLVAHSSSRYFDGNTSKRMLMVQLFYTYI